MTQLKTMYPGVANSPDTFLVEGLTIDGTVMYVADGAVFGEIPTLAVIGQAELAETVQITGKQSDGGYTIIRGVEGKRQAWAKATNVARNWTNKDYEALRANITAINDGKVDKVAGKGLSTHDYTDAAKAKVDAIPPDPKYTDTVPDLTSYAKAADLSIERAERKADIVKVRSDHATDIQGVKADIKTAKDALTVVIQQKLNKSDIVNDLTTGGVDKALSAEQGKTLFTYADNGKKSIADAIVGKGVDATKSDDFNTLADKISKIKTGYGVGDVLPEESVQVVKVRDDSKVKWGRWSSNNFYKYLHCIAVDKHNRIYARTDDRSIVKLDTDFNNVVQEYKNYGADLIDSIAINADGKILYSEKGTHQVRSLYLSTSNMSSSFLSLSGTNQCVNKIVIGSDSCVYTGENNDTVRKVSAGGKTIWEKKLIDARQNTADHTLVDAIAIGRDGSVYSGHCGGYVFKTSSTGDKVWQYKLDASYVKAVGVDDTGYVYVGGYSETAGAGDNGKIIKLSPTGGKIWEKPLYDKYVSCLTLALDGSVWCGGNDNHIYKLSRNGEILFNGVNNEKVNGVLQDINDTTDLVTGYDGRIFGASKTRATVFTLIDGTYTTSYKIIK